MWLTEPQKYKLDLSMSENYSFLFGGFMHIPEKYRGTKLAEAVIWGRIKMPKFANEQEENFWWATLNRQFHGIWVNEVQKAKDDAIKGMIQKLDNDLHGAYSIPLNSIDLNDVTPMLPSGSYVASTPQECKHEFKIYRGFSESYDYCVKCDQKKGI